MLNETLILLAQFMRDNDIEISMDYIPAGGQQIIIYAGNNKIEMGTVINDQIITKHLEEINNTSENGY